MSDLSNRFARREFLKSSLLTGAAGGALAAGALQGGLLSAAELGKPTAAAPPVSSGKATLPMGKNDKGGSSSRESRIESRCSKERMAMQPKRYPISSWQTLTDWDVDLAQRAAEWLDIGFTLIMSPAVTNEPATHKKARQLLDLCGAAGIDVILTDRRVQAPSGHWGKPSTKIDLPVDYRQQAAKAVAEFADHPALWGFFVTDEPLEGNLSAVAKACRIVRELTDQAEPYVNYLPNHLLSPDGTSAGIGRHVGFKDFGAYLDHVVSETDATMLCYDQYCSMSPEWGGPDQWYRCLSDYQRAAIRHDIPFWNIILAHGHWMYRAPNPLEMSWQFYNSLAYGAQGIMYFMYRAGGIGGYGAPVDELGNRGPLFFQLQRQHAQFMGQWAWRYRQCRPVATCHWPSAPAGLNRFDGSGVVTGIVEDPSTLHRPAGASHLVVGEFLDDEKRPHVVVANGSWSKHTFAKITVRGRGVFNIVGDGQEKPLGRAEEGRLSFATHFMPGQAMFFRVEV